ncbi:Imm1 family immunity protein [Glycomyces xiaoerkulensis]|uniref:Imm1 family immunity protein n=1 Tax=Glycomyces xiaoerkulensis TaxID=2038139 RepID=UPI00130013D3|nr:Imm1 family immunity protein [Glycomyces xiaoerkulensis]
MSAGPASARIAGYCAEFRIRTDSGPQILLACDPDGVAAAIATIMAVELVQVPTALVRDRPGYEPGGRPDHGLKIATDPETEIGALAYFGPGGVDYGPGAWVSYTDGPPHPEVKLYRDMEADSAFPSDAHIALSLLARAVEDFRATGGLRPAIVSWRPSTVW